MKKTLIITTLLSILISMSCDKSSDIGRTPFHTDEWHNCYTMCEKSMTSNLRDLFTKKEIEDMNVPELCVDFCRKALYLRRNPSK